MAHVNHLELGMEPPKSDRYVVVARDVTGGFYVVSSADGYRRGASPKDYPISEADREAALARAKDLADRNGIETVYVVS
jgi:hypothetical protein